MIARPQIPYRFHQCMALIREYEDAQGVGYPFLYMLLADIWIKRSV